MRYFLFLCIVFLFSCRNNNVKEKADLKHHFDKYGLHGCFSLMDNKTGQFTIYNLKRYRDSSYAPGSAFDIVNSLIGLQTGVILNDSMAIVTESNGRKETVNLYQALRNGSLPYFQEIARRIGKEKMQFWLDSLGYGAKAENQRVALRSAVDSFWLDQTMAITPDVQLGIIIRLYFNKLPFFKPYQETVKRILKREDNTLYRLCWHYAESKGAGNKAYSWLSGWIEENNHPYFFVVHADKPADTTGFQPRMTGLLKDILTAEGFFEGKK
ncbi:MAG: penicillin-binding transpeptidase domain-containing protein [Chitinophagaceae bacterium]|nr:penicillin-binding transpeptidase domain-containing protein [Chitinophagaceae bacterium]